MEQRTETLDSQAIKELELRHQERLQKKLKLAQAIAFAKEHPEAKIKDVATTYKVNENTLRIKLFRMKRSVALQLNEAQPKIEKRGRKKKSANVVLDVENASNHQKVKEKQHQSALESIKQLGDIKRELEASKRLTRRLKHKLAHLRKEKKTLKEEFLEATTQTKRLKIDFEESLEREKKLKLEVKKEQEEVQKIQNTTGVLANIALAHNKYFEEKVQKNGGLICPVTQEPYRLEDKQIILKAMECGHYLSKGGWEGMAKGPYGAFCPSCRCEGNYLHAWAETMMANQKLLMDNYMKYQNSFEEVLKMNSISIEEPSTAMNSQEELIQIFNQLQKEVDYPQEILDELIAILPDPSVNNFHQFLQNREKTIPRSKDWSQVSAETFASKKKFWTPPVSQTEIAANLHASDVSHFMHHFNLTLEEAERRVRRERRISIIVQPQNEITLAPGSNLLDVIAPQRQQN